MTALSQMETVRERLREYWRTVNFFGDGATVKICTVEEALAYRTAQAPDGSWEEVDYGCTESAANGLPWNPYLALDRMQAMAAAWDRPGHPGYHSPDLLAGVEAALAHWETVPGDPKTPGAKGPWSVNWWENGIGPQLRFGRIGVMLRDVLSPAALGVLTRKLQTDGDRGTGQNSLWFTQNSLFRALITQDEARFPALAAQMNGKMAVQTGPESREAVQVDGSYHGHGELFMTHQYGMALFRDMSLWGWALRETDFALSRETVGILSDYMLEGTRWTIRGDVLELDCGYTPCAPGGYARQWYREPIRRMMALDPARKEDYQILLDNIDGKRPDNGLSGFTYMWTSAYTSQMRRAYGINLRMDSRVIKGAEWRANWKGGPDHGNLLFWSTAGALTVTADGRELADVYPVYDWRHIPGTTAPFALSHRDNDIAGDTAMGVTDGITGAAAMKYRKDDWAGISAGCVGYFFFEEGVLSLGAGITSTSEAPIHTTLAQCRGGRVTQGPGWIHNDRTGYLLLDTPGLRHALQDPEELDLPTLWRGTYAQFSIDNVVLNGTFSVPCPVFSLWLDHGIRPAEAAFGYFVLPAVTPEQTAAAAADCPVTVLVNSPALQAAAHRDGTVQAHFYSPGTLTLPGGGTLTAEAPCSVMLKGDSLTAAVPNHGGEETLALALNGVPLSLPLEAPPYRGRSVFVKI